MKKQGIQCRVWDGEKMIYKSEENQYGYHYTLDLDGTFYGHINDGNETKPKNYILQLYSTVKDIEKKKIYDGDIVECDYNGRKVIRKIMFYRGAFRVVTGKKQRNRSTKILHPVKVYKNNIKVIGNICEDSKLVHNKAL